jgi:hypothetical protein
MNELSNVLAELRSERNRLNQAIASLEEIGTNGTRPKKSMSAAGRARIAAAQKKRWAKWKRAKAA